MNKIRELYYYLLLLFYTSSRLHPMIRFCLASILTSLVVRLFEAVADKQLGEKYPEVFHWFALSELILAAIGMELFDKYRERIFPRLAVIIPVSYFLESIGFFLTIFAVYHPGFMVGRGLAAFAACVRISVLIPIIRETAKEVRLRHELTIRALSLIVSVISIVLITPVIPITPLGAAGVVSFLALLCAIYLVRAPLPISLIVEEDNRELPRLFKNNHKEEEGKEEPSQNDPTRALIIGSWGMAIFTQFIFAIRPFYLTQGFFLAFYCAQLVIMMIAVFYESNSRRINSLLIAGRCAAVIAMLCIALQITFGGEKYVWIAVLAYFFAQVCNAPFGYLVHEKAVNKIASQNLRERQFLYAGLIVNVLFSLFFPNSPYFVWGLAFMTFSSLAYLLVRRREHML